MGQVGYVRPPSIWTGGHYHNGPTQYLRSNINFLTLSMFCYLTVYVIYLYSAVNCMEFSQLIIRKIIVSRCH